MSLYLLFSEGAKENILFVRIFVGSIFAGAFFSLLNLPWPEKPTGIINFAVALVWGITLTVLFLPFEFSDVLTGKIETITISERFFPSFSTLTTTTFHDLRQ